MAFCSVMSFFSNAKHKKPDGDSELPPFLQEKVRRTFELLDFEEQGLLYRGICYFEGEYSPDKSESWCHVQILENELMMYHGEMRKSIPYSELKKAYLTKWKGLGSGVRIEFGSESIYMTPRRSNFRGWILGVDYPTTLRFFQELRRKIREENSKIDKVNIC